MTKLGCYYKDDLIYISIDATDRSIKMDTHTSKLFLEYAEFFSDISASVEDCETETKSSKKDRCGSCNSYYMESLQKGYVWFTLTEKGLITVTTESNDGKLEELISFIKENFPEWYNQIVEVFYRHTGSNWYYLASAEKILKKQAVKKPVPLTDADSEIISKRMDT